MTAEGELNHLRHEKRLLREQASLHQDTMSVQRELISQQPAQIMVLDQELSLQQHQLTQLAEQVKALQERLAKDSPNSHLPPVVEAFRASSQESAPDKRQEARRPGGPPRPNPAVLAVSR